MFTHVLSRSQHSSNLRAESFAEFINSIAQAAIPRSLIKYGFVNQVSQHGFKATTLWTQKKGLYHFVTEIFCWPRSPGQLFKSTSRGQPSHDDRPNNPMTTGPHSPMTGPTASWQQGLTVPWQQGLTAPWLAPQPHDARAPTAPWHGAPKAPWWQGPRAPWQSSHSPMMIGPHSPTMTGPHSPMMTRPHSPMMTGPHSFMMTGPPTPNPDMSEPHSHTSWKTEPYYCYGLRLSW